MTDRIIKTPAAKQDLWHIADHIAENNVDAAIRFLDAVEGAFSDLADMPKMGQKMEFRRIPDCRHWVMANPFSSYTIFYIPLSDDRIKVIRVLHGARDVEGMFDSS